MHAPGPSPIHRETNVRPLTPGNLWWWIWRTARRDVRRYRAPDRGWSARRLVRSVWPTVERPVFVVGSLASGSTQLGTCLAALPALSYHYEPIITKAASRYVYRALWGFEEARDLYRTTYRWLMRLHFDGGLRLAERTLRNSFIIPFLAEAFPDAQFVHLVRDGREAARILRERPNLRADRAASGEREPGGYAHGPYARFWVEPERVQEFETTTDLHRCIWTWRRHVEAVLDAATDLSGAQYHEVRYDALAADPDAEAVRLTDFLGVADAACRARVQRLLRAVPTAPACAVPDGPVTDAEAAVMEAEAGPLLRRLGYAPVEGAPVDAAADAPLA